MHGVNPRNLFIHSTVFALALGVSVFTYAQDASTPSSRSSAKKSDNSAKGSKSANSDSASGKEPIADKLFVKKAAQGGLAEVELGTLASQKGSSDAVKQFGQKMVDDHGKANDELKTLAQQKNITLPTELNAEEKALKTKLDKLSGDQFDKAYMSHMVKDHTKDVAEFKREANNGKDPDVKAWASKTEPTLESHLSTAKQDWASLGGSKEMKKGKKAATHESASQ